MQFIRESIERHLDDRLASSSSSPSSSSLDAEPRDFIDLYLAEMLKPANNNSQTAAAPSPPSGSDTTSFHSNQVSDYINEFIQQADYISPIIFISLIDQFNNIFFCY